MRVRVAITIAACLIAGEAAASSVLQVEGGGSVWSPSVMVFPQPPTVASVPSAEGLERVGPSVFVVGRPPAVSEESVAAVDGAAPAVMRGGVYGEALPAPVVEPEPVTELSRPAQRKKERDERRAIRDAIRFGEPLPEKAETQPQTGQPATDQGSGT